MTAEDQAKTPEQEALEVLRKAQEARVAAANEEIAAVLKKYGVTLQVVQSIAVVPVR